MTAATDGTHLLHAILDDPDADDRRLVYADWLEDEGQSERAEFIRAAVAAAATGQVDCERKKSPGPGPANHRLIRCGFCDFCRPMKRAGEIHRASGSWLFFDDEPPFPFAYTIDHYSLDDDPAGGHVTLYLWRGFVERVRCTLDAWRKHGPALVRAHPVRRVDPTDRIAVISNDADAVGPGMPGWFDVLHYDGPYSGPPREPDDLPSAIWDLLKGASIEEGYKWYPPGGLHLDALSDACILWAKGQ